MKTTRRSFLKTLAGLAVFAAFPFSIFENLPGKISNMRPLRNQVGVYHGRGGTIGWFINNEAVAVIDTQYPESAKQFIIALNEQTTRTVDYVFNTHHHYDHKQVYADTIFSENLRVELGSEIIETRMGGCALSCAFDELSLK